jgi:serine/threonine protein kinase
MRPDESTGGNGAHYRDQAEFARQRTRPAATVEQQPADPWHPASSATQSDPEVAAALEEYLNAVRSGSPPSREEFLDRHPEIATVLDECIAGLEFIQGAGIQFATGPDSRPSPTLEDTTLPSRARLGDYRILREVGRGSMGVVYEAEQISLGRQVALKVLPFAAAIDPRQRQRFLIEAQAAAQLHHPHIVPIFAAGCDQGVHFYAMQFVDGRSLAELIDEFRREKTDAPELADRAGSASNGQAIESLSSPAAADSPTVTLVDQPVDPLRGQRPRSDPAHGTPRSSSATGSSQKARARGYALARLGIQAAEALEHAHALGVVHRDIKPANLMVDTRGELWITDFGLARFRGDVSLTRSGDIVGTLRYMSPEQALAQHGVVDERTDIYALGLTLYELLTLRPAFDGRDHAELLRQIAQDEPIPPRRLDASIPRDLETIVLKAIRKEPSSRYTSAQELADDLVRFCDDQPIQARRPTALERTRRWARRHKQIVLTTVSVLLVALIGAAALVGVQAKKTELMRQELLSYVKQSFSPIDAITIAAMGQATQAAQAPGAPPEMLRKQMAEVYSKALDFYEHAAGLPPIDIASRTIIARAHFRMGFTHSCMSLYDYWKDETRKSHLEKAKANYNGAVKEFEQLLAEAPGNLEIRAHLADALGEWGLGFFLIRTSGPQAALPTYRRAIEIRRELVLDPRAEPLLIGGELVKLLDLSMTLENVLQQTGQTQEAEKLRQQNMSTSENLAASLASSERRHEPAAALAEYGKILFGSHNLKAASDILRLSLEFEPDQADVLNALAWALVSVPDAPPYNPQEGLTAIRRAVDLVPGLWAYWNTLGVAAYRVGDYKTAVEALAKSMSLNKPGDASDYFFMAMTRWKQNQPAEARKWFDRGKALKLENKSENPEELKQFQAEAEVVLGLPKAPSVSASKPEASH